MKLYSKEEFLKLPSGTLFVFGPADWTEGQIEPGYLALNVKYESLRDDFVFRPLIDIEVRSSEERDELNDFILGEMKTCDISSDIPMDLFATSRDGLFEKDSTYLVLSNEELKAVIASLQTLVK